MAKAKSMLEEIRQFYNDDILAIIRDKATASGDVYIPPYTNSTYYVNEYLRVDGDHPQMMSTVYRDWRSAWESATQTYKRLKGDVLYVIPVPVTITHI